MTRCTRLKPEAVILTERETYIQTDGWFDVFVCMYCVYVVCMDVWLYGGTDRLLDRSMVRRDKHYKHCRQ